jgi:hypothetical protein
MSFPGEAPDRTSGQPSGGIEPFRWDNAETGAADSSARIGDQGNAETSGARTGDADT